MHTENIVVTQKHWSTEHKYKIEELEDYTNSTFGSDFGSNPIYISGLSQRKIVQETSQTR